MECLMQYLDDIEDAIFAVALLGERLRRFALGLLRMLALALLAGLGIVLATNQLPLALALSALTAVGLLYHSVVSPAPAAGRG